MKRTLTALSPVVLVMLAGAPTFAAEKTAPPAEQAVPAPTPAQNVPGPAAQHAEEASGTKAQGRAGHNAPEAAERDMNALFPQPVPNVSLSQRPSKPELESPTFYEKIADSKVVLKWKETPGASVYHVQVATDPNFKWLLKEESLLKGTSMEVSGIEGGKSYFWRVAGVKPENKNGHIQGVYSASMFEAVAK